MLFTFRHLCRFLVEVAIAAAPAAAPATQFDRWGPVPSLYTGNDIVDFLADEERSDCSQSFPGASSSFPLNASSRRILITLQCVDVMAVSQSLEDAIPCSKYLDVHEISRSLNVL